MTVAAPATRSERRRLTLPSYWPWLVLAAIVLLAFAVRVVDVTDTPPGFFTDEAAAGLDAEAILTTGKDMHGNTLPFFFRSLEDYKLPVFIYSLVPVVGVLGLSEFSVRFTVVLFGTATVVTTHLLAREFFRSDDGAPVWRYELPALVAAAVLAVLPWHIHYSRTGFGEMVSLPLVFTMAWWLFLRANRTGGSLIPAAIAFGVCFYTYRSGWVVLPPFLVVLLILYGRELWGRRRDALFAGVALAVVLLPLAWHVLLGPEERASQASVFNVDSEQSTASLIVEQYRSYFTTGFLFSDGDNGFITRHYLPGHGVLYWPMLPLLLAGVAYCAWRHNRRCLLLLALVFLYPLGGALSDMSPISSRAILGAVVASLLMGAGVLGVVEAVRAFRPQLAPAAALATAAAVVLVGAVSLGGYLNRYFDEYPDVSEDFWGWQGGPQEILARYETLQDDYDELYLEGFFNAPHVFIPFYTGDACPKCRIGDASRYDPSKRQLFAFRVESPQLGMVEFEPKEFFFYQNGKPGFVIGEIVGER
jgi:4-amino-4-deoxy-L-arabinose transferase-like glycosyltransferase